MGLEESRLDGIFGAPELAAVLAWMRSATSSRSKQAQSIASILASGIHKANEQRVRLGGEGRARRAALVGHSLQRKSKRSSEGRPEGQSSSYEWYTKAPVQALPAASARPAFPLMRIFISLASISEGLHSARGWAGKLVLALVLAARMQLCPTSFCVSRHVLGIVLGIVDDAVLRQPAAAVLLAPGLVASSEYWQLQLQNVPASPPGTAMEKWTGRDDGPAHCIFSTYYSFQSLPAQIPRGAINFNDSHNSNIFNSLRNSSNSNNIPPPPMLGVSLSVSLVKLFLRFSARFPARGFIEQRILIDLPRVGQEIRKSPSRRPGPMHSPCCVPRPHSAPVLSPILSPKAEHHRLQSPPIASPRIQNPLSPAIRIRCIDQYPLSSVISYASYRVNSEVEYRGYPCTPQPASS
ncbi:hypothetical protein AOQ84DRAFT_220998 [Glonium stellatum]|uniref:Uncharacterized protein n=1 Tax=Glonium stellatum TaxID=574774 RepID=A0A8E2F2D7_9PEZI|nr:hypothetical protein AOQ84DRAFT_220998 [Glonium stellatum]